MLYTRKDQACDFGSLNFKGLPERAFQTTQKMQRFSIVTPASVRGPSPARPSASCGAADLAATESAGRTAAIQWPLLAQLKVCSQGAQSFAAGALTGGSWPVAEINPLRPKRKLKGRAPAEKVNSRAGSRRRTTGQRPTVVRRDTTLQSGQFT